MLDKKLVRLCCITGRHLVDLAEGVNKTPLGSVFHEIFWCSGILSTLCASPTCHPTTIYINTCISYSYCM